MGRIRAWSLAAALGAVNAACAYNRPIPEAPLAVADSGAAAPLEARWLARAGRAFTPPFAFDDTTFYGVGIDRRVVALDLRTGRRRWMFRLDGPSLSGVILRNGLVLAGSERPGDDIVALDAQTGRRRWKRGVGYVSAPAGLLGDLLVVTTRDRGSWALDATTGRVRWHIARGGGRLTPLTGGDGSLLLATRDSLFRLSLADGSVRSARPAPGAFVADWVPAGRGIIAGSGEGAVVLLDPGTLTPRWRTPLDGPVLVTPTVRGDTVWVATQPGTLWRLSLESGEPTRLFTHGVPVTAPPLPWHDMLLVGDARGLLHAYDSTGSVQWRLAVGRPVEVAPIPFADGLLVIGGRGDLHRFVEVGR